MNAGGGAGAGDDKYDGLVLDVVAESPNFNPIHGLMAIQLVCLATAINFLPNAQVFSGGVILATMFAKKYKRVNPDDPLSIDEIASIQFYTQQSPFYGQLSTALRSEDRTIVKPFLAYLKLVLTALSKLPRVTGSVYRGIKLHINQLGGNYGEGEECLWWGFSSTTKSLKVLNDDAFLGASGDRTILHITVVRGVDIKKYSAFKKEDEVLLLPATYLRVDGVLPQPGGFTMVQMTELDYGSTFMDFAPAATPPPAPSAEQMMAEQMAAMELKHKAELEAGQAKAKAELEAMKHQQELKAEQDKAMHAAEMLKAEQDKAEQERLVALLKAEQAKKAKPAAPPPRNPVLDNPLIDASGQGDLGKVRDLLDRGAGVNAVDGSKETPLHWASCYGHEAVAALLLERGAGVNAVDGSKMTPLHWASRYGHEAVAALLRKHGGR